MSTNPRKCSKSRSTATKSRSGRGRQEDKIVQVPIDEIQPAPENDRLYRPIDPQSPAMVEMVGSVRARGVLEPLVVTRDGYILSGHRRYMAARLAGLKTIPCRMKPWSRSDDIDRFVHYLREHNRYRKKTLDEELREEIVSADPEEAYNSLIEHRSRVVTPAARPLKLAGEKRRCRISEAKHPFLNAIHEIIEERKEYWPLTVRVIHYALLNNPPLKHASKPKSRYDNTLNSYKSLDDLLTRARLEGLIPMDAIGDETRPVTVWNVHQSVTSFMASELNGMFKNYWRDLMQSQPDHIEIVGEKNTIDPIIRQVAEKYCIPTTTGRGYCSLPPRHQIVQRYQISGKHRLVLLMLSDFDPDGEEIVHSFARSLRDDFGVENIYPIKVGLTAEQVKEFGLPPMMTAKKSSAHFDKFTELHGETVHELEALSPEQLQQILQEAIDSLIDTDRFNAELEEEKREAVFLAGVRKTVHSALQNIDPQEYS